MNFDDVQSSIDEAIRTLRNADDLVNKIAWVMKGRLKQVSPYTLARLKKELNDFNSKTKTRK